MKIDKLKLVSFIKHIQYSLLSIEGQRKIGEGKDLFVEDWLTIELAKFFYIGKEVYLSDPIPRRLKDNQNFNQEQIVKFAEQKIEIFSDLKLSRLKISQVGRGLDVLLAQMQKEWKSITCYDDDHRYEPLLFSFFKESNISFICESIFPVTKEEIEDTHVIENRFF
jgi:hypothetical protein